ncbi:hypothetical protein MES4922_230047 [Mesorhizobium ventifaucium]|uniref:Uncharacterized protein n=1 Tax=Mesorhizobium ventifaucium TaxID=666020 RepID=A0ABM9DUW4_9HYPH|nr:hypothetical protein MES4922_230047 [Mesorhizobium ventifaucium]
MTAYLELERVLACPSRLELLPACQATSEVALSSLFQLPYATRAILYDLVVLGAVMALRERRLQ